LDVTSSQASAATRADASSRTFAFVALALGGLHLLVVGLTSGFRIEVVLVDGLIMGLPWVGPRALAFTSALLPIWLTAVVVDGQRYLPLLGKIHTGGMHALEMSIFPGPGGVTWPEWLNAHPHTILDFFCGASYLLFLYEFFALVLFFFVVKRDQVAPLVWAFFWANTIGAVIYMLCPVAPPWYIIEHGLGPAIRNAAPGLGGCARFDALLHINYFHAFYGKNPNVFGAMPSLHVSYPLLCVLFTWNRGWKWRVPTILFDALVIFSAVYLAHHWILDVIAGLVVAVVSYYLGNLVASWRPGIHVDPVPRPAFSGEVKS
jgi:membrane-associated phospholipid phosphatase